MTEVVVPENLKHIVEGAILAAGEALSVDRLLGLFEEHERPSKTELLEVLNELRDEVTARGFYLVEVASGWRYQVDPSLAPWVNRLWEEKPQKYSRALLETLALIAYRQPLTRSDIEEVRGVAVSSHIIKTLAEREWIKVVGHRDVPGRPSLYATTKHFLDYFGLKSLDELPTLGELKDIDSLNERLQLEEDEAQIERQQIDEARSDLSDSEAEDSAHGTGSDDQQETNAQESTAEPSAQQSEQSESTDSSDDSNEDMVDQKASDEDLKSL